MGASASRIWSNICEIDSDTVRIGVIRKVLADPAYVELATSAGVYTTVVEWVMQMQHGIVMPFPYRRTPSPSHASLPAGSDSMRYAHLYSAPTGAGGRPVISHDSGGGGGGGRGTAIIESPAAKAMDYFQEAMALLGIDESEDLTHERVRAAYKRESLRAHPDKGGSKEKFDELRKAYQYIGKILDRVKPRPDERMTTAVTLETATAARNASAPAAPVRLSAKKLDMTTFNRLFEENRLPDPAVDGGYGDWMAQENARRDEEPAKQMSKAAWEEAFRKKAIRQGREGGAAALTKRLEPDAIISPHGTELGGEVRNFTAAFGADNQFTDLKEAYTSGATVMHEVAGVRVVERSATSVQEAQRIREAEMARVDPDESARFEAAAAAVADRERQRRLRLAQQDITMDTWADRMRGRLAVTDA